MEFDGVDVLAVLPIEVRGEVVGLVSSIISVVVVDVAVTGDM